MLNIAFKKWFMCWQRECLLLKDDLHQIGWAPAFVRRGPGFARAGDLVGSKIARLARLRCPLFNVLCFANEPPAIDFLRFVLDAEGF